jgi:hypothetical protein
LRSAASIVVLLALALAAATFATAEVEQEGNLIVSFDGRISPRALPRVGTAPVSVSVDTTIKTSDGTDPPPQLREIAIGINREGKLFNRGLPTCKVRSIQPATIEAARRICGAAIVGSGQVSVRVFLENQQPFTFTGPLLAFNATPSGGERRILAQVYGSRPPSAFVLTFKILRRPGTFGTLIRTTLPHSARNWVYITHFEMRLRRTYVYRGKRRSYLSAGCAAPPGFPGALYPFARGTFEFAGGRDVTSTLTRDCKVR